MNTFLFGIFQIFKKPWIFLITVAMMSVGLIVSFYSFLVYDSYHFPTRQAKKVLNYDLNDVYKINFGMSILGLHSDDFDKLNKLYEQIGDIQGVDYWGGYFVSRNGTADMLYVYPSLVGLCDVRTNDNRTLAFDYSHIQDGYGIAYVGGDLSNIYPVGSKYHDEETGCEYIISGVLKDGTKWLPDDLYGSSAMNMDNVLLLDLKYAIAQPENTVYLANASNFLLIASEDDGVKDRINTLLNKLEFNVDGIARLGSLYSSYEKDAMDQAGENYLLPLVLLLSAMIVSVITARMSVMASKKDYGIMLSNGFNKANIIGIILTENAIKCFCAFLICILYWTLQRLNMDEFTNALYKDMFGFRFGLFFVILFLMCEFPVRYILRSKPTDLLNRREL